MYKLFVIALNMLHREWRSGELSVLLLSIIIAVASMSSIGLFTDRIERSMLNQSGQFLGADLLLKSPVPVQTSWLDKAKQNTLSISNAMDFSSVVIANENFQLAHIKAVDSHSTLR